MRAKIRAKTYEIQKARLERGLSQIAMARVLRIHNKHLSAIENSKSALSPELANRICQLLGKQFSQIFFITDVSSREQMVSRDKLF